MTDVSKQSHYTANKIEPIEYIRNVMTTDELRGYYWGNVIKYISRWKLKGGIEDLEKAKVYLDWMIELQKQTATSKTDLGANITWTVINKGWQQCSTEDAKHE